MSKYSTLTNNTGQWNLDIPKIEVVEDIIDIKISKEGYADTAHEVAVGEDMKVLNTQLGQIVTISSEYVGRLWDRIEHEFMGSQDPDKTLEVRFSQLPPDQQANYTVSTRYPPRAVDVGGKGKIMATVYSSNQNPKAFCAVIAPVSESDYMVAEDCRGLCACYANKIDLKGLDTHGVSDFSLMFQHSRVTDDSFLVDLDVSKAEDIGNMFQGCTELNLDISKLDFPLTLSKCDSAFRGVPAVTAGDIVAFYLKHKDNLNTFGDMFAEMNLSKTDFSVFNLTNFTRFFYGANLDDVDLDSLNTSTCTNMLAMFSTSTSTSINLSNFDTSNVTDMSRMFYMCHDLVNLNLSNFDTSNVTDMGDMFGSCHSLVNLDLSNFDTSKVTDMSYMFSNCLSLVNLDLSNFDTSNVTDMSRMFGSCENLTTLDISGFTIKDGTNVRSMFDTLGVGSLLTVYVKDEATKAYLEDPDNGAVDVSISGTREVNFVVKQ